LQESEEQLSFEQFQIYFKNLSPQEQAGFFLWPSVGGYELTNDEAQLFNQIKPSGIVLFKRNFLNVEQSKTLISNICASRESVNTSSHTPFIVSVDEEGGRVSRLPFKEKTKSVLSFAQNKDKIGLKKQVATQIDLAKTLGINCILAPVLDIFTEKQNNVIGDRSFGYTAEEVCEYASVVFEALEDARMFSCGKHFPGHGNTKEDSHKSAAISEASRTLMESREWVPFKYFISKNIPFVMAAHVMTPHLFSSDRPLIPATLNSEVLTKILREDFAFSGLILSDDLRMGAIQKYYEEKNLGQDYLKYACIDALKAGCDVLLSCHSIIDEKVIIDSIIDMMQKEKQFLDLCYEKAYRQIRVLRSHFKTNK